MVRTSRGFVDRVLLPEFTELEGALQVYLHEVTLRVISASIRCASYMAHVSCLFYSWSFQAANAARISVKLGLPFSAASS
jgi:hypothetical protein